MSTIPSSLAEHEVMPADLRCEYHRDPLGIDTPKPRLSWILESDRRGDRQTAYRIRVRRDRKLVWDSGKVVSDQSAHVAYAGPALQSGARYDWSVRLWDASGKETAWSAPACWAMGLLDTSDWHASWIGTTGAASETMLLRREFEVKAKVKRALVHVCGLGHYEMTINGKRVGNDLLAPGWTKYDKTCLYDTYDITPLLRKGRNVACLLLGNGMYNVKGGRYTKFTGSFGPLKAIAQMRLEYANGTVETIGTDGKWQASPGPITFSCVYGGEDYDARIEPDWQAAAVVAGPGGTLRGLSCAAPPVRAFDALQPVAVKQL
jgi:hypothetical protein